MGGSVRHVAGVVGFDSCGAAIAPEYVADPRGGAREIPPQQTAPAAQAAPVPAQLPAAKQIALTDKQIEGVLAAQKDMDAITAKLVDNAKPDSTMAAQFEGVAGKSGFAGCDEYSNVLDNIRIRLARFHPA